MTELQAINITAWATVGTAIASIVAVFVAFYLARKQVAEARNSFILQLTVQVLNEYDSRQFRELRSELARGLLTNEEPIPKQWEPILDKFETVAELMDRRLLDESLCYDSFSLPVIYWWQLLSKYVDKHRHDFHDSLIYMKSEKLACKYRNQIKQEQQGYEFTDVGLKSFLRSEVAYKTC